MYQDEFSVSKCSLWPLWGGQVRGDSESQGKGWGRDSGGGEVREGSELKGLWEGARGDHVLDPRCSHRPMAGRLRITPRSLF